MIVLLSLAVLTAACGLGVTVRAHRATPAPTGASRLLRDARLRLEDVATGQIRGGNMSGGRVEQTHALSGWLTVEQAHAELCEEALGPQRLRLLGDDAYPDHVSSALRFARSVAA